MNTNCTSCPAGTTTILPAAGGRDECGSKYSKWYNNDELSNILRGGLQSPRGGFQEGPLKNKTLKYTLKV